MTASTATAARSSSRITPVAANFGPNLTGGSTLDQFETAGLHSDFISIGQSVGQTYGRGGSGGNGQMPGFGPRTDNDLEVTYPATLTQDQIDAIVAFERNL